MKTLAKLGAGLLVLSLVGLWTTIGNGAGASKRAGAERAEKGPAGKAETYAVVKVGDEVQIVRKSELTSLKKSLAEEDKKARKEYDEQKKAAKTKEDKAALGKPPAKRVVKQLKAGFKTEDDAKDWLDKNPQDQAGGEKGGRKTPAQ